MTRSSIIFPSHRLPELATGSNGYLPTPRHHDLRGYETWLGTNRVERGASEKITARALEMLQRVRTSP